MEITIRRSEPGDAAALQGIFSGPRVIAGTLQLPYPTVEMWRQRLADPPEGMHGLAAIVQVDGRAELVGHLGLHTGQRPRRRHVGWLGMAVHDDWQGQGIGAALMTAAVDLADNWLALTRLELTVFTDNAPAVRLYEKFGFVIEGTMIKYAFRAGRYRDVYAMARLLHD